ncbi:MAG TPA: Ku protein [Mycobacteriales bacterium]|jgi:DNA end-binding protein Ku|nr:Ku protein [Mycobacteriales bacterium]
MTMARALWTGYVTFGLVSVPVGLFRATEDQTVHFHQIHKGTSHRIRYKKVDEVTGDEIPATEIVNGFDLGDGEYVIVTKEELKDAAPGKSEQIEISDFVDLAAIDPIYFRSTYYLAPRGKGADRAYSLLRQAMQESKKIGIATLVLRDKEHLVAIRPGDEALVLETMHFPAEIRSASEELDSLPEQVSFEGRELTVAKTLIDSLTVEWEPDRYQNTYRAKIEELIESKRDGKVIVAKTSKPKTNVVDLMAALEASVARTGGSGSGTPAKSGKTDRAARPASTAPIPLEELSKAKLSELAAEFEIAGRSSMSKQDLVSALNDAGAPAKPKRRKAASA